MTVESASGVPRSKSIGAQTAEPGGGMLLLDEVLGVRRVQKVYLQVLFRCNFRCRHCFHGEALNRRDIMSTADVAPLLALFRRRYDTDTVCLLGGEPLLHPDLDEILKEARTLGFRTEICTNGFGKQDILNRCRPYLDHLRVSLDGTQEVHDLLRRPGSFAAARRTLRWAAREQLEAGVTCTLTGNNVETIPALIEQLATLRVEELVIHRLRHLGNAARFQLRDVSRDQAQRLLERLPVDPTFRPRIRMDSDILNEAGCGIPQTSASREVLDRVEVAPDGQLYLSCKAVGSGTNAFRYDFTSRSILHVPQKNDELANSTPQVVYV